MRQCIEQVKGRSGDHTEAALVSEGSADSKFHIHIDLEV